MLAGLHCDCLVCRVEKHLIEELGEECAAEEFSRGRFPSDFRSPLDLVHRLHRPEISSCAPATDRLLARLVAEHTEAPAGSLWQRLLLLVFVPTIHRTASQVALAFPSLARDDISQHSLTAFLEFLGSSDLRRRTTHVAFTVARHLRRRVFRWAIHERRLATPENREDKLAEEVDERGILGPEAILETFLDTCEVSGWLSRDERRLLMEYKVGRVGSSELGRRHGASSSACRHRVHRILERLRSVAEKAPPHQFELFEIREKIFSRARNNSTIAGRLVG